MSILGALRRAFYRVARFELPLRGAVVFGDSKIPFETSARVGAIAAVRVVLPPDAVAQSVEIRDDDAPHWRVELFAYEPVHTARIGPEFRRTGGAVYLRARCIG